MGVIGMSNSHVTDRFAEARDTATKASSQADKSLKTLMNYLVNVAPVDLLPVFNLPEFEMLELARGERPTPPSIVFPELSVPDVQVDAPKFTYSDTPYSSDLLDPLFEKLRNGIEQGGSGLGIEAEAALRDRDRIAREQALQDQLDALNDDWSESSAGDLGMPDGALAVGRRRLRQVSMATEQTASKDISVKMIEAARQQEEVFLREAAQVENITASKHTSDQARALDAAKVEPDIIIKSIEASIAKARLSVEVYNAIATKANAEAQIYKAQMDGYVAEADIGSKELLASTEKHKANVSAASAESEANWRTSGNIVEQLKNIWGLRIQGMQAIMQVFTNLQAAAMTSVSASASLGASSSTSYSESEAISTTTSTTTSDGRSFTESHNHNYNED